MIKYHFKTILMVNLFFIYFIIFLIKHVFILKINPTQLFFQSNTNILFLLLFQNTNQI